MTTNRHKTTQGKTMTTASYRAKCYYGMETTIIGPRTTDIESADDMLNRMLAIDGATGGQIEEYIDGIGWVVAIDD